MFLLHHIMINIDFTMVNQEAIQIIDKLYSDRERLFHTYSEDFHNNIQIFLMLKRLLVTTDVSKNKIFQNEYSSFFLLRFMPKKGHYFSMLEDVKNDSDSLNALSLTNKLKGMLGGNYYSFATKMMCIVDDRRFPIYDSKVEAVFSRKDSGTGLHYKNIIYYDILDTYRALHNHPIIQAFIDEFQAKDIGVMKILDAIFWVYSGKAKCIWPH